MIAPSTVPIISLPTIDACPTKLSTAPPTAEPNCLAPGTAFTPADIPEPTAPPTLPAISAPCSIAPTTLAPPGTAETNLPAPDNS